jgi:hypothetical protein
MSEDEYTLKNAGATVVGTVVAVAALYYGPIAIDALKQKRRDRKAAKQLKKAEAL